MGTKLSQQPQNKPTFLEQIGTLIFHIRERSRLAAKRAFNPPAATVSTARQGDIVGQFLIQTKTDYIQRYQRAGEFFEASELELIRQHFNGGTYIDVGANIGNHAVYFGQLPNCSKVLAFEPNPASLRLLKINVLLNHLDEKIEVHPYALGQSDTTETITFASGNLGRAIIEHEGGQPAPGPERLAIQVKNGDKVLQGVNADFIKIDVEGFEMQVLYGLEKTVRRCRPTLFVEVWQENRQDSEAFLSAANYKTTKSLHNGAFDLILAEAV